MKNKIKDLALDGVVRQNPTFKLVLGTCPTLALTTAAASCMGMGLAVTFVLICSNIIISALRNVIPDKVRIPCFIVIIATFVTVVRMFMEAYMPDLYDSLGVYLPLIVVNCIILGRAESFASHNPVLDSAFDGLFMGIGFTLALTLMGCFRELLAFGSVFGADVWKAQPLLDEAGNVVKDALTGQVVYGDKFGIAFFGSSAGAFLTFGLFIAVFTAISNAVERKLKHKHAQAVESATDEAQQSTAKEGATC